MSLKSATKPVVKPLYEREDHGLTDGLWLAGEGVQETVVQNLFHGVKA